MLCPINFLQRFKFLSSLDAASFLAYLTLNKHTMLNGSALFGRLLPYYLIDKKYAFGHSVPIEPIIYASVMLGAKLFIYTH